MNVEMRKDKQLLDVAWFKDQISRRGLTHREVAMKLGINHTLISHMYAGSRKMGLDEAMQWAEILKVAPDLLIKKAGITLPPRILVNTRPGGKALRDQRIELSGWIDSEMVVHLGPVKGMTPVQNPTGALGVEALRQGAAILYYQPPIDTLAKDILTRLCVVRIKGQKVYRLRVVARGYEEGEYNLMSLNGEPREESVILESAVPIVWMKL